MSSTSNSKQRRRPSKAERRAAQRRREQRRMIAYVAAAAAVVAIIAVVLSSSSGGGSGKPAPSGQVTVSGAPRQSELQAGDAVPGFSAPALGGGRVSWSDYEGAPTALAVWAPWCPHCQKELPVLARVAADFPSVKLVSVATAIGLHPGPSPGEYMRDNGLTFPVAIDDGDGSLGAALGINAFPTVYWVGPDGVVAQTTVGEVPEDQMRSLFQSLA